MKSVYSKDLQNVESTAFIYPESKLTFNLHVIITETLRIRLFFILDIMM
jgi:hypothetical protein